jgi:hypothetical protein
VATAAPPAPVPSASPVAPATSAPSIATAARPAPLPSASAAPATAASAPSPSGPAQPQTQPGSSTAPITSEEPAPDERLFAPEGSAEGCASGECLPEDAEADAAPAQLTSHDIWRRAVEGVRATSIRFGKSLSFARLVSAEPGLLKIAFPNEAGFHRATVFGSGRPEIEKHISTALGQATRLQEDSSNASLAAAPKSIAEQELTDRTARENSIDARVRVHPAVQNILKYFGGQVEHVQVLDPLPPAGAETPPPPEDDA